MNNVVQLQVETDPLGSLDSVVLPLTASGGPETPPAEWFQNPGLTAATPIEVTPEGRVYGHIAPWGVSHIGMPGRTAPKSASNYAYFRTGVLTASGGKKIPVGQLTLSGGHASILANAEQAVKHYDDTKSAVADLAAGEDRHGIWVAGALRPGVTPDQVRALRASAPSGDWRPINGRLELIGICQVNVPGFPIARAMVAAGECMALVAAGASHMYRVRMLQALGQDELVEKVAELEAMVASLSVRQTKAELRSRVSSNHSPATR